MGTEAEDLLNRLIDETEAERARRRTADAPVHTQTEGDFLPEARKSQGVQQMLIKDAQRRKVRAWVENQTPLTQFLIGAAPATVGAVFGSPLGLVGAMGVGALGEVLGQDIGLTPKSDLGIGLAAGGPLVGRVVGIALKGLRKGVAKTAGALPPTRAALARHTMRKAVDELEDVATKIMASKKGFIRFKASRLYEVAEKSGVRIPAFRTTSTRKGFTALKREINLLPKTPQSKAFLRLVDEVEQTMKGSSVSLGDLVAVRKIIGGGIDHLKTSVKSSKLGQVNGAKKALFKAMADDLDHLAGLGGRTGKHAKIAVAAVQRAKLDFAMSDFKAGVAKFTTFLEGSNTTVINVQNLRKWMLDRTNPSSAFYNKQMAEAFADDLPMIMESLRKLSRFGKAASPGGVGSLIIRGKGAGAGAAIGTVVAGPIGATAGTLIGAASPEIATAILSSPAAVGFLEKAAGIGGREISKKAWDIAGQIAMQGVKFEERQSPGATMGRARKAVDLSRLASEQVGQNVVDTLTLNF